MKKKLFILGICTMTLCGCGKIPKLSNGEEAVTTFKDDYKISANELYKEIKDNYGLDTLVKMINKHMFEKEVPGKIEEAKSYSENLIAGLKQNYETDQEILSYAMYTTNMPFQTVSAYQDYIYVNYLQNEAIKKYVGDNITDEEYQKYYDNDIYPNMTISHILINSNATEDMTDEDKTKEENKAKDKAKEVIKKLDEASKNGKDINEEFTKLAKEYSTDDSTKEKSGDLGEINIGSFDSKYDELVKSANTLKDGEYSKEVITTEEGYHVILKTKTGEKKSLEEEKDNMKTKITENKINEKPSIIADAIMYFKDKYDIKVIDSELDKQYGIYTNNLINSYKNAEKQKTSN